MSIIWSPHHTVRTKAFLAPRIIMLSLGLISTVAAIFRLTLQYDPRNASDPFTHGASICIWSVVEMASSTTAACLPSLKPLLTTVSTFIANLSPTRRSSTKHPTQRHHHNPDSTPPSPYPHSYSTPTFLSLPRPKPARFHDHTSDLDFDLFEAPATRHSRNPSNLMVFTNFTSNFTVPPFDREIEAARGVGKEGGYAVSVTSGETCEGSEEVRTVSTVRTVASEESCHAAVGGIMRTMEVRIS